MSRNTVDFGIDLGTTNSEIGVIEGSDVHIFKNNENTENTASALYVDRRERLFVGRKAKDRAEEDPDNVRIEFKRDMGLQQSYRFKDSGKVMTPEECSAEVLKSLKGDVAQRTGEEVNSAVITVPAMFELPACDATRRAAQMAGIENCPLLQEPVAAALAYGFNADADNVFWMVYDLGGGTFDAALVSVRDGRIQVVDHDGENHLGGKDLDWLLLEELVLPKLRNEYSLSGLRRGEARYASALAKLKAAAEKTKIELSRRPTAILEVLDLCEDERGQPVDAEIEISSAEYARVIAPTIERSIAICRRIVERNRLGSADIEKLILVGGPTLTPVVRDQLRDGLGLPLDISVDPITAVARGAAIFAGSQIISKESRAAQAPLAVGTLSIDLAYEPITPDDEPFIGGKIVSNDGASDSLRIEFVRSDGGWRSGLLPVAENGAFSAELRLQPRKPNTFNIEVSDAQGRRREVSPASFVMTHGLGVDNPPLPRSLGVALADDSVQVYLAKDTQLPARTRSVHRTARAFVRGQSGDLLRIPIVEGEHARASRNRLIGTLAIPGDQLSRDLRLGAEIEVRVEMDASRKLSMTAYIPDLDQEFSDVQGQTASQVSSPEVLRDELKAQGARMDAIREALEKVDSTSGREARDILFMLEAQDDMHDIERLVEAARNEADAAKNADERLKDLAAQIDTAEDAIEWPQLEATVREYSKDARQAVEDSEADELLKQLDTVEVEIRAALRARDKETVEARKNDLGNIWYDARQRDPRFWAGLFLNLRDDRTLADFGDVHTARRLFEQGQTAFDARDIPTLRRTVNDLFDLLPSHEKAKAGMSFGSGIV